MAYYSGDTIRVKTTFRDFAEPPTVGAAVDPDEVAVILYNVDESVLESIPDGNARIVRAGTGIYYLDWVLPTTAGNYYIEFKGTFNDATGAEPCIIRQKVQVKFKL